MIDSDKDNNRNDRKTAKKSNARAVISFDYAAKQLLRNKADYVILEGFLSELLMRQIKIKGIPESESNRKTADSKQNQVDILVEDENNELMIIEIQFKQEMDFLQRMLYYSSQRIVENMHKKMPYSKVRKIYSINILYFKLGESDDYVYHGKTDFIGLHTNSILHLSELQRSTFGKEEAGDLYPEYYLLNVGIFDNIAKSALDEWIYYLKNDEVLDHFTAKGLPEVREKLAYDKLSPEEQRRYDKECRNKLSWDSVIETVKGEARLAFGKIIEDKDKEIEEKDKALESKDKALEDLKRRIAELENGKQKRTHYQP
jgi:hypothetical protein